MMKNLRRAEVSPRVENGNLFWYEGDTFHLIIRLELKDLTGRKIDLTADDQLELVIRDCREDRILGFSFTGEALEAGSVTLQMDETKAALLPAGKYTYDVYLTHGDRVTLAKRNSITVEEGQKDYV